MNVFFIGIQNEFLTNFVVNFNVLGNYLIKLLIIDSKFYHKFKNYCKYKHNYIVEVVFKIKI